ncbi:hypothetical protein V498_01931 [Pseudogymnoascus sp. VKM F-4517 (FW-2822)]|nr:hypothetical protein V498_01931 [Pseudogymnoascus sp. VKM F-4517 (FW-2822)]
MSNSKKPLGIDTANAKTLADFVTDYLPTDTPWTSFTHPTMGGKYTIELQNSSNLTRDDLAACFSLVEESSKGDYSASKQGWKPTAKRREMRLLELKYLLIRSAEPRDGEEKGMAGGIEAFASFMPTIEDEQEVLYVYEIHLAPSLRRSGLGRQLMKLVEGVARKIGVEKVMLSCFTRNATAKGFYEGIGYEKDEYSPPPRVLRDGREVEEAYVILKRHDNGNIDIEKYLDLRHSALVPLIFYSTPRTITYDHRLKRIGHPVRSAIHKLLNRGNRHVVESETLCRALRREASVIGKGHMALHRRRQLATACLILVFLHLWLGGPFLRASRPKHVEAYIQQNYPLVAQHVWNNNGKGAWYIPNEWRRESDPPITTILQAAHFASSRAAELSRTIPYSDIPLIIHQIWLGTKIDQWAPDLPGGIEQWLKFATVEGKESMAYFLWLDDGCDQLIADVEPELVDILKALPLPVERSDVFRVVVVNSIGGIYGDIDTNPLRSPATWIDEDDIKPWIDQKTSITYSPSSGNWKPPHNIRLLLGIEADNDPNTDAYWRMGYNFPIQLTQWALASAPKHPVLNRFIATFKNRVAELATPYKGNLTATAEAGVLAREDPLKFTGPEAITVATMAQLKDDAGLRWEAVTGLQDGGRSKAVGDTIIFPITAFSPGRSKYGNMGSKPLTDPDARLQHRAQGSWRKKDMYVEMGKICRTVLGMCRDWSKVPQ